MNFCYEPYLDNLNVNIRVNMTRLRLSAHNLRVASGRYSKPQVPYQERYCQCCNTTDIEDVYHLRLLCPSYTDAKTQYINPNFFKHPSMPFLLKSHQKLDFGYNN